MFTPMPVEVLGGWGESGIEVVKRLGTALARHSGQEEAEVTRHLFGRLSILLMRGNSQMITARIPTHVNPTINGIL